MSYPAYPHYKPSGMEWLGDVPEHWEVNAVFRIAVAIQTGPFGSQLHEADYVEGGIPLINPAHIIDGRLAPEELSAVDEATAARLKRHQFRTGDIVMGRRGEIGRCAAITAREESWICGTGSLVVRLINCDPGYYAIVLSSAGFRAVLELNAVGTTMLNLNPSIVGRMRVPCPPLVEQRAIADFLDTQTAKLDTLVAKKRKLIERLKEKRTALISRTVTRGLPPDAAVAACLDPHPKLKPSGIEWLGEMPQHWEVAQLRRFTRLITSGSRGWAEYYADQGAIFVRIGNLTRDSIRVDLSDVQCVDPPPGTEGERTRIKHCDLLFSITAYLGSVAVATESVVGGYINQHIALVRVQLDKLVPAFAAYATLSDIGQAQLSGQGYGGTKIQLGLDDVKSVWLPVPPVPEQHAIADCLDRETAKIDQMIAKVETAIERLQEYRTALITAAVTGKIDVRGLATVAVEPGPQAIVEPDRQNIPNTV